MERIDKSERKKIVDEVVEVMREEFKADLKKHNAKHKKIAKDIAELKKAISDAGIRNF